MEVKKPTIITYRNPTSDLDVLVEIESIAEKLSEQLLAVFNETGEIPKNLHLQLRKLKEEKPRDEENGMIAYIKLFMGYKKKSASSIAQEMGVSISTLTKFIQYDTRPTPATLEKIRNWIVKHKHNTYNYLFYLRTKCPKEVHEFITEEEFWNLKNIYKDQSWYAW